MIPVYPEDDANSVAERYMAFKNITLNKNQLRSLTILIEDKINSASLLVEDFISKYENQSKVKLNKPDSLVLKEKAAMDRNQMEKMIKEAKTFNFTVEQRNLQRQSEESLIGKIYVELENKKVVKSIL